jgi:hypothetical protein
MAPEDFDASDDLASQLQEALFRIQELEARTDELANANADVVPEHDAEGEFAEESTKHFAIWDKTPTTFKIRAGEVYINGTPIASTSITDFPGTGAISDDVTYTAAPWFAWLWVRIAGSSTPALAWKTGTAVDTKTYTHEPWPMVEVNADGEPVQCYDGDIHI